MSSTPRPTRNSSRVTPQVFTYLDETMNFMNDGQYTTSNCSPWILRGPPDVPIIKVQKELSNLQVRSLQDYKTILPVQLGPHFGMRTPELYYLMIEYFSQLSAIHAIYCRTTPEGFSGSFIGPAEDITVLQGQLDMQFSQLVTLCYPNAISYEYNPDFEVQHGYCDCTGLNTNTNTNIS